MVIKHLVFTKSDINRSEGRSILERITVGRLLWQEYEWKYVLSPHVYDLKSTNTNAIQLTSDRKIRRMLYHILLSQPFEDLQIIKDN